MMKYIVLSLRFIIRDPKNSWPNDETHFAVLYPRSSAFIRDPYLMAIGEGQNVDSPVNQKVTLLADLILHHHDKS